MKYTLLLFCSILLLGCNSVNDEIRQKIEDEVYAKSKNALLIKSIKKGKTTNEFKYLGNSFEDNDYEITIEVQDDVWVLKNGNSSEFRVYTQKPSQYESRAFNGQPTFLKAGETYTVIRNYRTQK